MLERLYGVVGGRFDLDPCSPSGDPRTAPVKAAIHLTVHEDGLTAEWHGKVFCNPPYGRIIGAWTSKCRTSVEEGRASIVIALIPARSDTSWWHRDVAGSADVWLLRGRLAFGDGLNAAPFASALVGWGLDERQRFGITSAFPEAWHVPVAKVPSIAVR